MVRLLGFPAGDGFVVIASNYGKARHPGWYDDLPAHPRAELVVGGRPRMVVADQTTGQARAQLWERALTYYPGLAELPKTPPGPTDRRLPACGTR